MTSGLRRWLAPDVDPHADSFLGYRIAGLPGPVWSLAAWALVMALTMSLNVVTYVLNGGPLVSRAVAAGYWLAVMLIVLLVGVRTPSWLIHLIVDANILVVALISASAPTELRASVNALYFIIPAVYVATWLPRRQMMLHLAYLTAAAVAALASTGVRLEDVPEMVRAMIVVLAVCWGVAVFVNALVGHLNQQATVDPLTGLMNRVGLATVVESYSRTGSGERPRTLVVIDLDGFKQVNDTRGHEAGDEVLRQVGAALRAELRPQDVVTRLGGDEFVVLLDGATPQAAGEVVARLSKAMPIAFSSGIAAWPEDLTIEDAVARADEEMYREKARKRALRSPMA